MAGDEPAIFVSPGLVHLGWSNLSFRDRWEDSRDFALAAESPEIGDKSVHAGGFDAKRKSGVLKYFALQGIGFNLCCHERVGRLVDAIKLEMKSSTTAIGPEGSEHDFASVSMASREALKSRGDLLRFV